MCTIPFSYFFKQMQTLLTHFPSSTPAGHGFEIKWTEFPVQIVKGDKKN